MENLEKLKQRLINLEIEQKRQDREVNKLNNLDEEIRQFEEMLANFNDSIYTEKSEQTDGFGERTDLDEIDRLEKELSHIDDKKKAQPKQPVEEKKEETDDYSGMDENERRYFEEIRQLKSGKVKPSQKQRSQQRETRPTTAFIDNKPTNLEAELAKLDNYVAKDAQELRYLDEIKQLRTDLGLASADETLTYTQSKEVEEITTSQQKKTPPPSKQQGYVICLMFDPNSPNEWSEASGGGWRERGGGTCYQDIEQMKQSLRKIKKQWPNYPLKVVKR